jgi:uncharacterized protein (TIGR02246 family)
MLNRTSTRIAAVVVTCLGVAAVAAQIAGPTLKPGQPKAEGQAPRQASDQAARTKSEDQVARQASDALVAAFNRGNASEVAALFLPNAELTDDAGNVHKGRKAIEEILTRFFERFPGAQLQQQIVSSRLLGSWLAIQDGVQTVVTKDGQEKSVNRFTAVLVHLEGGWAYATCQQEPDEQEPTLHDRLEPLSWFVGDWVDEGPDAAVAISCRWSDDKNFLLVDYDSKIRAKAGVKSTQRIGWDPLTQRVRSWVFDSDGGYGEGHWTHVDASWIIKSTAVMPDGQTGSATIVVEPAGRDKFVMKGLDRILGDDTQPDFEVTIARKPPQPAQ